MKLLLARLNGGLGNQLFQYATARALTKPGGVLFFDTDSYKDDYLNRDFGLIHFKVKGRIVSNVLLKKIFTPRTKLNKIFSVFGLFKLIQEEGFRFHQDLKNQMRMFTLIRGYWQTEKYFKHIRPELLKEIVPKHLPEKPSFLRNPGTVAVHVRRTDYLDDQRYGFLGENYYREAMQQMRSGLRNPLFIFFSDDLSWCKEHFNEADCLFADDKDWNDDHLQLYLISQCRHQVIANSSFSWWGAWLNQNDKKMVIRPGRPFRDESFLYESHYPAEWIAL
jgi:hypothetical protein